LLGASLQTGPHLIHPVAAHQIVVLSERRSLPLKRDGDVDNFRLEIGLLLFQKRKNGGLPGQELSYPIVRRAPVFAPGAIDNDEFNYTVRTALRLPVDPWRDQFSVRYR
jgi:hypothetical protein